MENRGRIHINANDSNLGYRSRKLYQHENVHHNKNHNIFMNYYPYDDHQKEQQAYNIDSPLQME